VRIGSEIYRIVLTHFELNVKQHCHLEQREKEEPTKLNLWDGNRAKTEKNKNSFKKKYDLNTGV